MSLKIQEWIKVITLSQELEQRKSPSSAVRAAQHQATKWKNVAPTPQLNADTAPAKHNLKEAGRLQTPVFLSHQCVGTELVARKMVLMCVHFALCKGKVRCEAESTTFIFPFFCSYVNCSNDWVSIATISVILQMSYNIFMLPIQKNEMVA